MSAAPLLLGAERVRISAHPCFSLHETPAVVATLAFGVKQRTSLAGIVTLLSNLRRHLAVTDRLSSCFYKSLGHLTYRGIVLFGCGVRKTPAFGGADKVTLFHERLMAVLGPGRTGARWVCPCGL